MSDALIPAGARRKGPMESATDRTLSAYAAAEPARGAGPELSDLRAALRRAAFAIDVAHRNVRDHGGSPHTLAVCVKTYTELRLSVLPVGEVTGDPLDALIGDLLRAETGDSA